MAERRQQAQKKLEGGPSLDYGDDLSEDTRLMYEGYAKTMDQTKPSVNEKKKPAEASMDVCIFMRNRSGIHMQLDEGHNAEAEELFEIVVQENNLPKECEDVFSLWLVSPILELRLKKKHKPYFIVRQWDELCSLYTDAKAVEIQEDEPVLMFQRNVFFPIEQEQNIAHEQIQCLLYHEAKFNVLEGRYILARNEYHTLAGIQALLTWGKYSPRDHIIETYRASLYQFYPEHMYRKPSVSFFKKKTAEPKDDIENRWLDAHRQISQEFEHEDIDKILGTLYRRYMEVCWKYPFYGAAFFDSFINKPLGKLGFLKRNHNIETWAAINTNGVTIIDREKDEVLLAVPFTELCWEYIEPQFDVDDDAFPALLLQFLVTETNPDSGAPQQVTKVLQVYSRQARMMKALIESCVERKKHMGDQVDGGSDTDFQWGINKLDRMCLSTFSKSGECLD
ncbi:FERM domain-containing protein 8-like isoform X1 [Dreissena polymorpha]|uniref:FERM domain-containing protein 8-like isoform X1 n=1 Tax=Dreissena polymorpha TaxID=45954 RepID=UPI002263B0AE|nr:FERM domain-containing protein 8-like isoform X1 [Dreissena polymorpha]